MVFITQCLQELLVIDLAIFLPGFPVINVVATLHEFDADVGVWPIAVNGTLAINELFYKPPVG